MAAKASKPGSKSAASKSKAKAASPKAKRTRKPAPPKLAPREPEVEIVTHPFETESDFSPDIGTPERPFAERTEPLPPRDRPTARRAIFFDVENTSRPGDVRSLLEHLAIDRSRFVTDFVASGNWRVIGPQTARLLSSHGAQLVHSAPATGVRDWSDLRIAVSAGVWLASAQSGDVVEIVSDDRAFDAVGDVAASLGVTFRRLSYRALKAHGLPPLPETPAAEPGAAHPRPARGRGRGRGRSHRPTRAASSPAQGSATETIMGAAASAVAATEESSAAPVSNSPSTASGAQSAASEAEILALVTQLLESSPGGLRLDTIGARLKAAGHVRPPNSPRLVTRLRGMKSLRVSQRGLVQLASAAETGGTAEATSEASGEPEGAPGTGEAGAADAVKGKRRRRRGGRGRGRGRNGPAAAPPNPSGGTS